jgi:hypothetical protein
VVRRRPQGDRIQASISIREIAISFLLNRKFDSDDERRVLFTSEKAQASAPPVLAMLKAWPGRYDAYISGPVCVDRHTRGTGVLEALYAEVVIRLPGREAILFINA